MRLIPVRLTALVIFAIVLIGSASTRALAQGPADCRIDAVLLIDRGGSAAPDEFAQIQALASGIIGGLPMGGVRLGVIAFDGTAETRIGLSADGGAVAGAISGIAGGGGAADFITAIEAGAALVTAESRPYTTRAVVLITDGISARDARQRAREISAEGVAILAFGVAGGVNRRELGNIGLSYMNSAPTFSSAPAFAGEVAASLCRTSAVVGGSVAGRYPEDERGRRRILPVQGITVTLLTEDGAAIASTRTDSTGRYRFYVAPGRYVMRVEPADGLAFAPGNDGVIVNVNASRGFSNTRAYTLMDVIGL